MADVSKKLASILKMVDEGAYFIVNSPHKYGKTSLIHSLSNRLIVSDQYLVVFIHFQDFDDASFEKEAAFVNAFAQKIEDQVGDLKLTSLEGSNKFMGIRGLSEIITQVVSQTEKETVLIIDEIDHRANSRIFKHFLSVLRAKYLDRHPEKTFHSVVLEQSVRDPNNYAIIGRDADSPWNIATEFTIDLGFQVAELIPMLEEYQQDRGVAMDPLVIAEQLFYYTSGHPFLTSKLCKVLAEDLKRDETWTKEDVDNAVDYLVKNNQAESGILFACLESDPDLYKLVKAIVIDEGFFMFSHYDPSIKLGVLFGIFAEQSRLKIHNRIYHQVLMGYLS